MVRKNFFFHKNIESQFITISISNDFENNFIFFKKFNKELFRNNKIVSLKKINLNTQCVNIFYF
jgi:hypothetical protein